MAFDDVGYGHEQHQRTGGQNRIDQVGVAQKPGSQRLCREPDQPGQAQRPQKAEDSRDADRRLHGAVASAALTAGGDLGGGHHQSFGHKGQKQSVDRRDQTEHAQPFRAQDPRKIHIEHELDQTDDQIGDRQNHDILFNFAKKHSTTPAF